jgi:hypothetical protein
MSTYWSIVWEQDGILQLRFEKETVAAYKFLRRIQESVDRFASIKFVME